MALNLKLPNDQKQNPKENDIFQDTKERLYNEIISDMDHSSLDVNIDEESVKKANDKFKSIKIKKIIAFVVLVLFFVVLIISAFYKTFLEHDLSGVEIANVANYYNEKTNFPESGVAGYISKNIETLISENISFSKDVVNVKYRTPVLTRINSKNDIIANVYFYLWVDSSTGTDEFTCMLPLYFDKELNKYYPCGSLILTSIETTASSTERKPNPLMSFEGNVEMEETLSNSAKTYINNFFTMFYSDQDISPYYNGKNLNSGGLKFQGMKDFKIYVNKNTNGYNARCEITLISSTGLILKTNKYLSMSQSGASWLITSIL